MNFSKLVLRPTIQARRHADFSIVPACQDDLKRQRSPVQTAMTTGAGILTRSSA
jgi:hypothetical protein